MNKNKQIKNEKQPKSLNDNKDSVYDWGAIIEYNGLDIRNLKNPIVEAINNLKPSSKKLN